jgi:cytidine deaminase
MKSKKKEQYQIEYTEYSSLNNLAENDQELLEAAIGVAKDAYAPYSEFKVGAAIKLANGETVKGSNQENAAYPSGLCAERVALFSASANFPEKEMNTIAVYAEKLIENADQISPCGACRQVMSEYEHKQGKPLRVLLMNANGLVWEFESMRGLLPFAFTFKPFKK